jgi:hypothetical protein
MTDPYNPFDRTNLGRSVAEALLQQPVAPLSQTADLVGAGVYAIYYTGDFEPYLPVASRNRNNSFGQPIYVGKAVPKGARKEDCRLMPLWVHLFAIDYAIMLRQLTRPKI